MPASKDSKTVETHSSSSSQQSGQQMSGQQMSGQQMSGGGGAGMQSSQKTTIVTESHSQGPARTVPVQPHQAHETRDTMTHETRQRGAETVTVTVPVTRFESSNLESTRAGVTFTEDKQLTIPAPVVAPQIQHQQNLQLSGGASAEIHATTNVHQLSESQIKDMGPEEYARYRAKVEGLARSHEQDVSNKAAAYRGEVEKDADLIRQTLERQHVRDIEFRKDMVETTVDRQQLEIQMEAEYAMRVLEQERAQARSALDQAKMSSHIDVNIDSAIGTTHSQGKVVTTSETKKEETRGERR